MYDVIVIGAGAAGLMAAWTAAADGRKVMLIEKMEKAGRKIRISGKGRCNLTNDCPREEFLEKVRANAEFFNHSFRKFDNISVIKMFRKSGVKLSMERGGRVFPESGRAWEIADTLVERAIDAGVEMMCNTRVTEIVVLAGKVRGVKVITKKGFPRTLEAPNVIICTGGASYPATGSTGDGYLFADKLGHAVEEIRPALVPLVSRDDFVKSLGDLKLKNVRVTLRIDNENTREEFGEMDFSNRGIEGAVILRLSRDAVDAISEEKRVQIVLDLKPALEHEVIMERIDREINGEVPLRDTGDLYRKLMPKPLVMPFSKLTEIRCSEPVSNLDEQKRNTIAYKLKNIFINIDDYLDFEYAIVTAGGIDVKDIDPDTLQSKLVKGLYFAGEVMDIDADTGGYNLQIAFSTGYNAGKLIK